MSAADDLEDPNNKQAAQVTDTFQLVHHLKNSENEQIPIINLNPTFHEDYATAPTSNRGLKSAMENIREPNPEQVEALKLQVSMLTKENESLKTQNEQKTAQISEMQNEIHFLLKKLMRRGVKKDSTVETR